MSFSLAKIACTDANCSLSVSSLVAEAITGVAVLPLPVIVASGATGTQTVPGTVIAIRNLEAVSIRPTDPNTLSGQTPLVVSPNGFAALRAGDDLKWHRDEVSLKAVSHIAAGASTALAFTATTPAIVTTPAHIAGMFAVTLEDGTVGFVPFWK